MGMQRNDDVPIVGAVVGDVVAAPVTFRPTGMDDAHVGQVLFEMRLDVIGGSGRGNVLFRNEQLKARPPDVLSALPLDAWEVVVEEMEAWQQLSGFYNCPDVEKACMMSSCCCCTMLPCWFVYGGYCKAPSDMMARVTTINRALAPHGLVVEGDDRLQGGKFLVFKMQR